MPEKISYEIRKIYGSKIDRHFVETEADLFSLLAHPAVGKVYVFKIYKSEDGSIIKSEKLDVTPRKTSISLKTVLEKPISAIPPDSPKYFEEKFILPHSIINTLKNYTLPTRKLKLTLPSAVRASYFGNKDILPRGIESKLKKQVALPKKLKVTEETLRIPKKLSVKNDAVLRHTKNKQHASVGIVTRPEKTKRKSNISLTKPGTARTNSRERKGTTMRGRR